MVCIVVVLLTAGFLWWRAKLPHSLLPKTITQQITGFTPYFYGSKIPAGYGMKVEDISVDNGVLMVPLTNPNASTIVLTEQAMPTNLKNEDLFQNSERIEGTAGIASVGGVEGRVVGTMVTNDRTVLILLTASDSAQKEDVSFLLKALQPIPR